MPAYDFRCRECAHVFEIVRRAKDTDAVACPKCDSEAKRVFTPVGVVFKGSGFHNTDYRPKTGDASSESSGDKSAAGESVAAPATPCSKKSDGGDCSGCPAAS